MSGVTKYSTARSRKFSIMKSNSNRPLDLFQPHYEVIFPVFVGERR